jgi:DMSO/TMAO reductase YedYZ molybdopterin-dependent catalytic subunit
MNRRSFLSAASLSAVGVAAAGCNSHGPRVGLSLIAWAERKNEAVERWLFSSSARDQVAADARLSGDAFPSYFISDKVPIWDSAARGAWRLEVTGAVRRPMSLSLDDLIRMRGVSERHNHYCVEGWMARAEFTGVRVSALAKLVEPTADAGYVDFQSFDKAYHESWDMESAMHPQTIVAYARDGRYLNPMQGAPARLHSPIKLGYKSTKYLTKIVFMPQRNGGYWTDAGYEWYAGV